MARQPTGPAWGLPVRISGRWGLVMLLACWMGLVVAPAGAQNTQSQQWPELDLFVKLNSSVRLGGIVKRSTDGENYNSAEVGGHLDITYKALRPLARAALRSNDETKGHYVTARVAYSHFDNTEKANEDRAVLELTPRYSWPWSILMSDRNRTELRFIGGKFSWRYRNRLTLERSFKIKSYSFTPYVGGELYYDSRYEIWNKNSYCVGVTFPIHRRIELEPYFERDNDSRSSPAHVNALGFKTSLYF